MLSDEEVASLGDRGWFMREGFLGETPARAAHAEVVAWAMRGLLRPAGVSRDARVEPDVRADAIAWLDPASAGPPLGALHARFVELGAALTRLAWLGLGRMDVQVAHYPGGGARYARHRDAFQGPESRRVTAIWYANPDWHPACGGILRLYPDGARSADLEPLLDRLVVFLAEKVEHEVLPAWAERLAVTAWYYPRHA
jgi:SM-20-related protein